VKGAVNALRFPHDMQLRRWRSPPSATPLGNSPAAGQPRVFRSGSDGNEGQVQLGEQTAEVAGAEGSAPRNEYAGDRPGCQGLMLRAGVVAIIWGRREERLLFSNSVHDCSDCNLECDIRYCE
jgi:hypothetical protein